jgi:thiamine-phosphate pyrophosphorylase
VLLNKDMPGINNPIVSARLYAFVDTAYLHGRKPAEVAKELCDGGADVLQLRAKNSNLGEIRQMAKEVFPVTHAAGVSLVINDHLSVAQEVDAEFCHLGQEDFFGAGFMEIATLKHDYPGLKIGLSTHSKGQALQAEAAGADYIAIGPVFPTGTKPQAKPITLELVQWAAKNIEVPWVAIGGITLDNLDQVLTAGAKCICVVSAILNAPSIVKACQEFKRRITSAAK